MAMKEWEDHQRKEGKPYKTSINPNSKPDLPRSTGAEVSHAFAKEAIAAIAGVEVDRLAETKGADWVDKERAKRDAKKKSGELYDQHYGGDENYNPEKKHPHRKLQEEFGN